MDEEKRIKSFFWPIRIEDIETNEEGRQVISVNFPSSRWVPNTKVSGVKWLLKHPNAAGLREYDGTYVVAKCILGATWDERYAELESNLEKKKQNEWIVPVYFIGW